MYAFAVMAWVVVAGEQPYAAGTKPEALADLSCCLLPLLPNRKPWLDLAHTSDPTGGPG